MPLEIYERERIKAIYELSGRTASASSIQQILAEEGTNTTRQTVTSTIERWLSTGSLEDRPRSGRPSLLLQEHIEFIDRKMAENDELTTRDLTDLLRANYPELKVSQTTVARQRSDLGWTKTSPRYCQLIRTVNMEKRMEWVKERIKDKEQFDDVIFSDESTIQVERNSRRCYHKKGQPRKLKPKPKHPLKVHVWAGISKRGATKIVIFKGKLIATKYTKILEESLLPFIKESYPGGHRFYQDNDPKHTSNYAKNFFAERAINWWRTPTRKSRSKSNRKYLGEHEDILTGQG